jgi:dCTP diphosphatase
MGDVLKDVQKEIKKFVKERNWEKYHSPKNLAMSVAIEAAELMEIFQWMTIEESQKVKDDPAKKIHVGEEISDVILYCLRLAEVMDINLEEALFDKIEKNKKKYPTDKYFGNYE